MSRCISCNKPLTNVPILPNGLEDNMCSRCIGISMTEYNIISDYHWTLEDAEEGLAIPHPPSE